MYSSRRVIISKNTCPRKQKPTKISEKVTTNENLWSHFESAPSTIKERKWKSPAHQSLYYANHAIKLKRRYQLDYEECPVLEEDSSSKRVQSSVIEEGSVLEEGPVLEGPVLEEGLVIEEDSVLEEGLVIEVDSVLEEGLVFEEDPVVLSLEKAAVAAAVAAATPRWTVLPLVEREGRDDLV
jgi:hypothetical protein